MSSSAASDFGICVAVALAVAGCDVEPSEYQFGFNVTGAEFELYSEDVGVHPSQDVLLDPNNPFRDYGVGAETKWDILSSGGGVASFYAWATLLATQPNGEHQYYTAVSLKTIYQTWTASEDELPLVRELAIRGFQAVLDDFPESVTFDPTGTIPSRLATFAFNEILGLGGRVLGDWILVQLPNGGTEAVRSASIDPPRAPITIPEDDS